MTDWENDSRLMTTNIFVIMNIMILMDNDDKKVTEKKTYFDTMIHDIILLVLIQQKFYDIRCTDSIYCISD